MFTIIVKTETNFYPHYFSTQEDAINFIFMLKDLAELTTFSLEVDEAIDINLDSNPSEITLN